MPGWAWIVSAVALLFVIGAIAGDPDEDQGSDAASTTTAATSTTAGSSDTESEELAEVATTATSTTTTLAATTTTLAATTTTLAATTTTLAATTTTLAPETTIALPVADSQQQFAQRFSDEQLANVLLASTRMEEMKTAVDEYDTETASTKAFEVSLLFLAMHDAAVDFPGADSTLGEQTISMTDRCAAAYAHAGTSMAVLDVAEMEAAGQEVSDCGDAMSDVSLVLAALSEAGS
jgi:hypothetical protein